MQAHCSLSPRSRIKEQIDRMLLHDFQSLRQHPLGRAELQVFKQNEVMMEYIRQIYNEYNLPDPLVEVNLSCLSSCPSGAKTIKKPKINLMSSQTLKYSVTPRNKIYEDHEDPIDYSTYMHDHTSLLHFYSHNASHSSLGQLYREAKTQQINKNSLIDLNYHYECGREVNGCDSESERWDMLIEVEERVQLEETVENMPYLLPVKEQKEEEEGGVSVNSEQSQNNLEPQSQRSAWTQFTPHPIFTNSLATNALASPLKSKLYFGQSSFMDTQYSGNECH